MRVRARSKLIMHEFRKSACAVGGWIQTDRVAGLCRLRVLFQYARPFEVVQSMRADGAFAHALEPGLEDRTRTSSLGSMAVSLMVEREIHYFASQSRDWFALRQESQRQSLPMRIYQTLRHDRAMSNSTSATSAPAHNQATRNVRLQL